MRISIPEARERLLAKAADLRKSADEIEALANSMYRRSPKQKHPMKSAPLTTGLAVKIRRYADAHPDASNQEIANHFSVNPGRVSEAIHGVR